MDCVVAGFIHLLRRDWALVGGVGLDVQKHQVLRLLQLLFGLPLGFNHPQLVFVWLQLTFRNRLFSRVYFVQFLLLKVNCFSFLLNKEVGSSEDIIPINSHSLSNFLLR